MDVPTQRYRREETPTIVRCKTGRTVVTTVQFQQVASIIVIIDTSEETTGSPTVTSIGYSLVACTHSHTWIGSRIQTGNGVTHVAIAVVFFLITCHQSEVVVIAQCKQVVGIKIDRLIASACIVTGKSTVLHHAQFGTCTQRCAHTVCTINHRSHVQSFVFYVHQLVSIVEVNEPVLERLNFETTSQVETVTGGSSVSTTLQIRNHGQFSEVTVRVNRVNSRTETCQ